MFLDYKSDKQLKICFFFTFIWGMIAHAYCFLHDTFSHDSLNALYASPSEDLWKIKLGRYLVPIVRQLTVGRVCLPWLTGIISLLCIALAAYGVCRIFHIRSSICVILTAGIMVTNITVTATAATYLYELSIDMVALLCAVVAAYIWRFKDRWMLLASVFVFITLGLYQSYVSVTITLMMLASIKDLLDDKEAGDVFVRGIKGIAELILGLIIYSLVLMLLVKLGNIDMNVDSYNAIYNVRELSVLSVIGRIPGLYKSTVGAYLKYKSVVPWYFVAFINVMLFGWVIFVTLTGIFKKRDFKAILLMIMLGGLLPFGMNTVYLVSGISSHDLMCYAFWLPYAFCLALLETDFHVQRVAISSFNIAVLLIIAILLVNVRTSNVAYMKKEFERRATVSMINRVQSCLDQRDDYIYRKTKIVFIGAPSFDMTGFETIENVIGMSFSSMFKKGGGISIQAGYNPYRAYYEYYLGDSDVLADDEKWMGIQNSEFVKEMTIFPDRESMRVIDGVMVVKLGEN